VKALYFDRDVARALAVQALGKVRKDLAFGRLSPVTYGEVPIPELPGPRWVQVANLECGLCGTDVHLMLQDIDARSFVAALPTPARIYLGHESWGRVVSVGDGARRGLNGSSEGFTSGDRVALRIQWPSCFQMEIDPPCRQCAAGSYMLCENMARFTADDLRGKHGDAETQEHPPENNRRAGDKRVASGKKQRRAVGRSKRKAAPATGEGTAVAAEQAAVDATASAAADNGLDIAAVETGGGFSPLMVAHVDQLFRIPEAVPNERAVLLEPTAVAVHAVLRRPPQPGDHVLVIGGGTIGLLIMAVLRVYAPEIELHCVVRQDVQAALAEWLGAIVHRPGPALTRDLARATGACHMHGMLNNEALLGGFDVVYDAVGTGDSLRDALRWTRARGTVLLVGAEMRSGRFDYTPLWHQEIDLLGVIGHGTEADGRTSFAHAADLLADPTFPVEGLVTHRFPMDHWQDAVHAFMNKRRSGAVKIVLEHLVD
jgi:threonine dehydrogenase-like Zn-dependent dehydrogenase